MSQLAQAFEEGWEYINSQPSSGEDIPGHGNFRIDWIKAERRPDYSRTWLHVWSVYRNGVLQERFRAKRYFSSHPSQIPQDWRREALFLEASGGVYRVITIEDEATP